MESNSDQNHITETQLKIMKLMDDLNLDASQKQYQKPLTDTIQNRIKQFKQQITDKYYALNEKVTSANSVLNQVQKQLNQALDYKRKVKINVMNMESIQEIQEDAKDFYAHMEQQKEEITKHIANKVLNIKLMGVEHDQNLKHEKQYTTKQLLKNSIAQLKKYQTSNKSALEIANIQLDTKIKTLKREVEEDSYRNKEQLKGYKSKILTVCEKVQQTIVKEDELLKESFNMHFETLQKLVASIADRIT